MRVNPVRTRFRRAFDVLAVTFILGLVIWNVGSIESRESSSPLPDEQWGVFVFSDYLTLKAGERFYQGDSFYDYTLQNMTVGYSEFSRGWYHYQVPLTNPNASIYYTHSGPMDGVINGVLRHMGVTELTRFLEFNVLLMGLSLGSWYISSSLLFGRAVGLISLLFIGTSLSALHYTNTISAHGQELFYAFGAMMLFLLAERGSSRRWLQWLGYGGAWALTFLQAQNTTEFIPFLQIFFIGYLWISRGNPLRAWRLILFMFSASAVSLLVHWGIVAASFGGFNNWFEDITAGVARRTTGFELAEETAWLGFDIGHTIPFLNEDLKYRLGMDFYDMGILLALVVAIYFLLRHNVGADRARQLSAQTKLLVVFLIGGFAFQAVFIQATVSQTQHMFKTVLPFAGLLFGLSSVMVFRHLIWNVRSWYVIVPSIIIFCLVAVPMVRDRGDGFDPIHASFPDAYYGRSQAELRMLTDFVRQSTQYGDIIITNLAVAEAGHPRYPFPAYEYLADRRFEVARDVLRAEEALAELEGIRQGLPSANPASRVNLYLLTNEEGNKGEFGEYARSVGELRCILDTEAWWHRNSGSVPAGERAAVFYLYRINTHQGAEWDLIAEAAASSE